MEKTTRMMRPRTLAEVDPDEEGIPYAVWKAKQLNELFKQYGVQKEPARIQPWVIADGLKKFTSSET